MILKTKSWHYRLARMGNKDIKYYTHLDLCSYLWTMAFGALLFLLSTFLIGMLLLATADFLAWCAAMLTVLKMIEPQLGAFIFSAAVAAIALFTGVILITEALRHKQIIPTPVREAYEGWKDKYCPVIEFKE